MLGLVGTGLVLGPELVVPNRNVWTLDHTMLNGSPVSAFDFARSAQEVLLLLERGREGLETLKEFTLPSAKTLEYFMTVGMAPVIMGSTLEINSGDKKWRFDNFPKTATVRLLRRNGQSA